jgi:predicted metal-binding membrane protein
MVRRTVFRIGFGHGVFCVTCCWASMATALAVGMNLWWMAALTAVVFIEQASARGSSSEPTWASHW